MDCIQDSTRVSTDVNCASKKITCGECLQVPGGWRGGERGEARLDQATGSRPLPCTAGAQRVLSELTSYSAGYWICNFHVLQPRGLGRGRLPEHQWGRLPPLNG